MQNSSHPIKVNASKKSQGGFSLVEIAISLIVMGIFIAAAIPLYQLYLEKEKHDDTLIKEKQIDIALETFKNLRGRYPCPARSDAKPSDIDYGQETKCVGSTPAAGTCINGICYEQSERQILVGATMQFPRVERGVLPFFALNLNEDQSYDAYGGRFSYAITELLADKTGFRLNRGGISIVDGSEPSPNSLVTPAASAHYFVFSHGPDRIGAYSRTGDQLSPCNGPMLDNENCNTDSTHATAVYRHALQSTIEVADINASGTLPPGAPPVPVSVNTHYDDFSDFVGIGTQPLWELAEDPLTNKMLGTANLHSAVDNKVIIAGGDKKLTMTGDLYVDVQGDAKIETKGKVDQICNDNDLLCMEALVIASPETDPLNISCSAADIAKGYAPRSVGNNKIKCIPVTDPIACPAGQIMYGVASDRTPMCKTLTNTRCAADTRDICGTTKSLPENAAAGTTVVLTGGASYSQSFTCDNKKWVNGPSSGVCNCTPGSKTKTSGCGANMSGQITTTTTTTCPDGKKTTTETGNTCACVPSTTTSTQNCPANYNGTITNTTTVTCNGNTPKTTTTQTGNTCACVVNTKNQNIACASGWNGNMTQTSTSACPSGTFGPWVTTANNCTCKPDFDQNKDCAKEYNIGSISETCSYNCSGNGTTAASLTCKEKSNTCKCVPSNTVTFKPCDAGYSGNIKVTTKTVCPGNINSVDEDKSACTPIVQTCKVTITDTTVLSHTKQAYQAGQTCSYSATNDPCTGIKNCSQLIGAGLYEAHACSCQ